MADLFELSRRFIDAGLKKATELGVKVSIVVVDVHGDLIILERMRGAVSLSPKIAMGKASASAIFMRPTAEFEQRIQQNSAFWAGVSSMTSGISPVRQGCRAVEERRGICWSDRS